MHRARTDRLPRRLPRAVHTDRLPSPLPPALPGAGPSWFPSVMGTGILATLLGLHATDLLGGRWVSAALLALGWALATALTIGFARRCRTHPGTWRTAINEPGQRLMWGTVSMGILALGAASATTLPLISPDWQATAARIDATAWVIGTTLGVVTALDFAIGLATRRHLGPPIPAWGLPVVAPMVSATAGGALLNSLSAPAAQQALWFFLVGCFALSLTLGVGIFASAFHHHMRRNALPLALWPSLWIPLGVVGQSTAAAQVLALHAPWQSSSALHLAHTYGLIALVVAAPIIAGYAAWMSLRGARRRMPFTPGWWAMTFPIGTCALGAHWLAQTQHAPGWEAVSRVITLLLIGTWTLCATATMRALRRQHIACKLDANVTIHL